MGCHTLSQGIFQTQGSNHIPYASYIGRWFLYHYHHLGKPTLGNIDILIILNILAHEYLAIYVFLLEYLLAVFCSFQCMRLFASLPKFTQICYSFSCYFKGNFIRNFLFMLLIDCIKNQHLFIGKRNSQKW